MKNWDDYLIDGKVLKNKLNLTNQEELLKAETTIVIEKLSLLIYTGMEGKFDSKHLCSIHKFLFSDIYDFAGSYREVLIYKDCTKFLEPEQIEFQLNKLMSEAKNAVISSNDKFSIANFLADYYYNLIMIHPFREGNGRTIREFLRQFTSYKFPEYKLDLTKIDKKNFLLGIVYHSSYPSLLAYEIYRSLELKKEKQL